MAGPIGGVRFTGFLQYLNTFPEPESVARSMARGPFAHYGVTSLNLWVHQDFTDLVCVGTHGLIAEYDNLYQRVALSFNAPITQSFLSGATVIVTLSEMVKAYPGLGIDNEYWNTVLEENGDGDVVQVPVLADGSPLGAFAFLTNRLNKWTPEDHAILDAVAAALGLWITHPRSSMLDLVTAAPSDGLNLSRRQMEILYLVREGKSNAAISARLGYSQSTVKQELQRITRRLRVHNRNEAVAQAIELNLLPEMASS